VPGFVDIKRRWFEKYPVLEKLFQAQLFGSGHKVNY
jgi:hypothetical protein